MRGEGQTVALGVRLEEREVVLDRLGGQGEDGRGEAAVEEIAPLGGQFGDREALGVRRERLEAVVDTLVTELVHALVPELVGGPVGGHGSLLERSHCNICNSHCV